MILLKLILTSGIVICATIIGIRKAKRFENREKILREGITFFKILKTEIKYMVNTLPNAIESARINLSSILKDCLGIISVKMLEGNISEALISDSIDEINDLLAYDKQLITSGIYMLGSANIESEINLVDNTIDLLINQYVEAKEIRKKNSKLYKTVGLVTGIMIAILFV